MSSNVCPICGKQIAWWWRQKDYCSNACKQKAYRHRLKLKASVTAPAPGNVPGAPRRNGSVTHGAVAAVTEPKRNKKETRRRKAVKS